MLAFKHLLAALTIASVVVASPTTAQSDPTDAINTVDEIIGQITGAASNIIGALSNLTAGDTSTSAAFTTQVKSLTRTLEDASHEIGNVNDIPNKFANDPRVVALNDNFSSFLVSTITSLSTIASSPSTSAFDKQILEKGAVHSISDLIDQFTDIVTDSDTRQFVDSLSAALAPVASTQTPGVGSASSILTGLFKHV